MSLACARRDRRKATHSTSSRNRIRLVASRSKTWVISKERNAAYPDMDGAMKDGAPFGTLIEVESDVDPSAKVIWFCDGGDGDQGLVTDFDAACRWLQGRRRNAGGCVSATAVGRAFHGMFSVARY